MKFDTHTTVFAGYFTVVERMNQLNNRVLQIVTRTRYSHILQLDVSSLINSPSSIPPLKSVLP